MKGKILDFSIQTSTGIISGNDNKRYSFNGSEWKEQVLPIRGMEVDFDIDALGHATGIYTVAAESVNTATVSPEHHTACCKPGSIRTSTIWPGFCIDA